MPLPTITVLDTTVAEAGPDQTLTDNIIKKDVPHRFTIAFGSGDSIVVEGKSDSADAYSVLHTFTDATPKDVFRSRYWRVRRSVDGGNDSTVTIQNVFNQNFIGHA